MKRFPGIKHVFYFCAKKITENKSLRCPERILSKDLLNDIKQE